jgi:DNA-binding NarL/FixJ family response regulator
MRPSTDEALGCLHEAAPAANVAAKRGALKLPGRAAPGVELLRILMLDDGSFVSEALANVIDLQPDMHLVGQANTAQAALELAELLSPDLVIVDFILADGSGESAARAIRELLPETKVVFLAADDDDERIRTALATGATGYLLKSERFDGLIARLRRVADGELVFSPPIGQRILKLLASSVAPPPRYIKPAPDATKPRKLAVLAALSDREIAILNLIGQGYTNRVIAAILKISLRSVEYHRANLKNRLGLHSRAELVSYAEKQGLVRRPAYRTP